MSSKKESHAFIYLNQMKDIFSRNSLAGRETNLDQELLNNSLFRRVLTESPSVMCVFNFRTMTYEFFSPNMETIFGYPAAQMKGLSGAEFGISLFHPDHLKILMGINEILQKYYFEYAALRRIQDTRASLTAKIKKSNGRYVWTLQQTMILEETAEGLPVRTICFISDITDIKTDHKVDFVFSLRNKDAVGYESLYSAHYDDSESQVLSRREIEIINCVGKGMRTQEIADKLNISAHTVSTHKRNILRKTGKSHIIQLIN